ncbi:MAG: hypothetical protein M5T61_16245 [Acidimicrobiia bacterium]|nr:hypothetical protein [Acidimicrobiia bacterium]
MTTTTPTTEHTATDPAHDGDGEPLRSAGDTVTVIAWRDPIVESAPGAIATDSDDALVWYTPSIGTIGMAMAHRFARHAADGPSTWTIDDIARTFGLGPSAPECCAAWTAWSGLGSSAATAPPSPCASGWHRSPTGSAAGSPPTWPPPTTPPDRHDRRPGGLAHPGRLPRHRPGPVL